MELPGLAGAFAAGLASFLSPCVLPIVPPYLCFLAGVSFEELTGADGKERKAGPRIVAMSVLFVLGFSTVFIALGATASVAGRFISEYYDVLRWIAGGVILIFGLHFLGLLRIGLFYRQARIEVERKPTGFFGAYLVGLAFGFGWTPCVGPVLGTILMIAGENGAMMTGMENPALEGAKLLSAYALGMGLPFIAAALFAGPFLRAMKGLRHRMGMIEKGMGAVLVVTGILFLTNGISAIGFWMQGFLPTLG